MIQIDSSTLIIDEGSVYGFTVKDLYSPEVKLYQPCDFCALERYCQIEDPQLCTLFGANSEEFYVKCGVVECDKEKHDIHILPLNGFQFI